MNCKEDGLLFSNAGPGNKPEKIKTERRRRRRTESFPQNEDRNKDFSPTMDPNQAPPQTKLKAIDALSLKNWLPFTTKNRNIKTRKELFCLSLRLQNNKEKGIWVSMNKWSKPISNLKNRNKKMKPNPAAKSWKDSWFFWSVSPNNESSPV